jgi:hypothetical protein
MELKLMICAAIVTLAGGCSDDSGKSDGQAQADAGENINEEGCEHMQQGPFVDVTAGSDRTSAAEVKGDHKAYRVTLAPRGINYVKLAADKKGDVILFLSADVTLEVQDDKGAKVSIEETDRDIKECTEVKVKHTFEAAGVGTCYFKLIPGGQAQVTLVLEAGHAH